MVASKLRHKRARERVALLGVYRSPLATRRLSRTNVSNLEGMLLGACLPRCQGSPTLGERLGEDLSCRQACLKVGCGAQILTLAKCRDRGLDPTNRQLRHLKVVLPLGDM